MTLPADLATTNLAMTNDQPETSGLLVVIVGPSGAGKDTLMDHARAAFAGDTRFVFARRVITRPAEAGGEDHLPATEEAFARAAKAGDFALSWSAHGLSYAIPASVDADLAAGRIVFANLSRKVIPEAEARFARLAVIEISAPAAILARRLAARGRESEADIAARLARDVPVEAARAPVHRISNDRELASVVEEFLTLLRALAR